jgi:hypothetical protein
MQHVCERKDVHAGFWWGELKEGDRDNIKTDLEEVGWGMDWINMAQDSAGGGLLLG